MNKMSVFAKYIRYQSINLRRSYSSNTNELVKVNIANGVKTIIMTDQKTRNSLSINMMERLIENISENKHDYNLRTIVIAAQGKVFSAGHNLKELSSSVDKSTHHKVFEVGSELMDAIMDCPVPVIAKVNGIAAAAGCQLVVQCDLAICSEHSIFSTPGVNLGIFCSTPGVALSRSVTKSTAMKMLLTGKPLNARTAQSSGLVAEVCPEDELDKVVDCYCEDIKSKSREVIELGKKFYYSQLNLNAREAFKIGGNIMVENLHLQDGKEGINSFIEKRKAIWTHGMK